MKLDVGCGHSPKGNVNIDLFIEATRHRSPDQKKLIDRPLDIKSIPNFICADACHIPIRDNVFSTVFSCHTIEHVDNPILMIKEMLRVSKRKVVIRCPHRFHHNPKRDVLHKHFFNKSWFIKTLKSLEYKSTSIKYSGYRYLPHAFIPIIRLPSEIKVVIYKREK